MMVDMEVQRMVVITAAGITMMVDMGGPTHGGDYGGGDYYDGGYGGPTHGGGDYGGG